VGVQKAHIAPWSDADTLAVRTLVGRYKGRSEEVPRNTGRPSVEQRLQRGAGYTIYGGGYPSPASSGRAVLHLVVCKLTENRVRTAWSEIRR
jgi:hypothetical protein